MKASDLFYPVDQFTHPWFGGVGFLCGLPVVRIDLSPGGKQVSCEQLVQDIKAIRKEQGAYAPRWAAITGVTRYADNDLLLAIRVHCAMQVCIETSGNESMCDRHGRLPMWDHVSVRVSLPMEGLKCERFDSVIVHPNGSRENMDAFSAYLDKLAFNGPRFVTGKGDISAVSRCGRAWRATRPIVPDASII